MYVSIESVIQFCIVVDISELLRGIFSIIEY